MRKNRLLFIGLCAIMVGFFSACHGGSDFNTGSDINASQTIGRGAEGSVYRFDGVDGIPKDETIVAMNGEAKGGVLMLPNPFVVCDSMEEAARLAGFDMVLPKIPDKLEVLKGTMIQAFYGENGEDMLIRKARGNGDISGDYNHYAQVKVMDGIILKGQNDSFFLAIWAKDGYAFSIRVGQALPRADLLALVAAVR